MDTLTWVAVAVTLLVAVAWYLSYTAARLDRLHTRVQGALSALDAQLVRRAEAAIELANSGALDPASALILASAATESLGAHPERAGADLLQRQSFAGREALESSLTEALETVLSPQLVERIHADLGPGGAALSRVEAAGRRVQLARRFHNDAATDVQRIRRKRLVRWFGLAGRAELPATIEFDDEVTLPGG